jgi:hypothetical protein
MGACSIILSAKGKNIKDAFNNAVEEANDYYGHQEGYSGTINTCQLVKDVTSKRPTMHPDELEQWMINNTHKREVMGYCVRQPKVNENKIKTKVDNIPQHGTRKWVTMYIAEDEWEGAVVAKAKTQTECIKKARAWVEKNPTRSVKVKIAKELQEGNRDCARITYKKAAGEKDGLYVFAGWAAE